ncbi:MAG: hypothetical protein COT18_11755 [Elusimicrobia bacterium CG08_land_8_20_14_0_20_59_10]|nr:MAG: hypothetical protein COT18_11755 [Elusimicrobia bacterium CG08_land_8_20_14_0_20_59_10]
MDRTAWQNLFKKRFVLNPVDERSREGEPTYSIKDKQFVIVIRSAVPAGALRAESVSDTEECLVVNRGQGKTAFVDWNIIEAITTVDN